MTPDIIIGFLKAQGPQPSQRIAELLGMNHDDVMATLDGLLREHRVVCVQNLWFVEGKK